MRRLAALVIIVLVSGGAFVACGFELADDTGKPIPGDYWPWVCADGTTPASDAGCPPFDAGVDGDAAHPADGAPRDH